MVSHVRPAGMIKQDLAEKLKEKIAGNPNDTGKLKKKSKVAVQSMPPNILQRRLVVALVRE